MSSTDSTRRSPATAIWVVSITSVNSAIGSRKRYVRKMNPMSAPAVSPLAGPSQTPTPTTALTVSAEKTSPDGNRNAPSRASTDLSDGLHLDRSCNIVLHLRAGPVRADRRRARHDLGDRAEHLRRCRDEPSRRRRSRRACTARSTKISGNETTKATSASCQLYASITAATITISVPSTQPGQTAPLEELRQRLDVAGDASHQTPTTLVVVVGQAQLVDVADQPHPEVVQRALAAHAEPEGRVPKATPEMTTAMAAAIAIWTMTSMSTPSLGEPTVDGLLDQDRHHHPARCADRREQPGQTEPLTKNRCGAQATTDRPDRRVLIRRRHRSGPGGQGRVDHAHDPATPTSTSLASRSASNASTSSRYARSTPSVRRACRAQRPVRRRRTRRRRRGRSSTVATRPSAPTNRRVASQVVQHDRLGRRIERRGRVVEHQQ